jgi:hypothetical protein
MSGGYFDGQGRLEDLAGAIDRLIAQNGVKDQFGWSYEYPPDVIARFQETATTLRRAAAMVQRVDWLVSGDDGEDAFRRRWEEEVEKEHP